jgi:uncharacterized LabA/DUF88 family protein
MQKVIVYIDGFNLYHGLVEKGWRRYLWLNIQKMAENLMMFNQELVCTKYFTARIRVGDKDKKQRQTTYIEALQTLTNLEIVEGKYHSEPYLCRNCGFLHNVPSEKMTDVNIASEMIIDAVKDKYDIGLLISADADLVPAIKIIRGNYAEKRVTVGFPPARYSKDVADSVNSSFYLSRAHFARNQLDEKITRGDGFILQRPITWS